MTFNNVTKIEITRQHNDGYDYIRSLRISHGEGEVEEIGLRTPMTEEWLRHAGNIPIKVDKGALTP